MPSPAPVCLPVRDGGRGQGAASNPLLVSKARRVGMDSDQVVYVASRALEITLLVSAPMLGAALVFGLVIAIFQAVTQIQEMTLTFIPKIVAVFVAAIVFSSWILQTLVGFTTELWRSIPQMVAGG